MCELNEGLFRTPTRGRCIGVCGVPLLLEAGLLHGLSLPQLRDILPHNREYRPHCKTLECHIYLSTGASATCMIIEVLPSSPRQSRKHGEGILLYPHIRARGLCQTSHATAGRDLPLREERIGSTAPHPHAVFFQRPFMYNMAPLRRHAGRILTASFPVSRKPPHTELFHI
jgi:hypothetical protein